MCVCVRAFVRACVHARVCASLTRRGADLLLLLINDPLLLRDDDQHLFALRLRARHHLPLLLQLDGHLAHLLRRIRQLLQAILELERLYSSFLNFLSLGCWAASRSRRR